VSVAGLKYLTGHAVRRFRWVSLDPIAALSTHQPP
jgi:hypothetical protein